MLHRIHMRVHTTCVHHVTDNCRLQLGQSYSHGHIIQEEHRLRGLQHA